MASTWYCRVEGGELGPLPPAALKQLVTQGRITPETPIRRGEDGPWVPAGKVKGLLDGQGDSSLQHDSSQLAAAAEGAAKSAKPAKKLLQAKTPAPAAARPAAPKPAIRSRDSTVLAGGAKANANSSEPPGARRRRKSIVPLVVTGVVLLVLTVVGAVAAIASFLTDSASQSLAHLEEAAQDASADGGTNFPGPTSRVEDDPSAGGPSASEAPDAYRRRVIRSIDQWRPALNRLGGTKKMKIRVDKVWLGNDAGRDANGPEFVSSARNAKFVFVRIVVGNPSPRSELDYAGWNADALQDQAILVDDRENFCPLVPLDESRNERLAAARIAPGKSVTDVLVFQAPQEKFEYLRLAVPFDRAGHYGMQIDAEMLSKTGPPEEVPIPVTAPDEPAPPPLEVDPSTDDEPEAAPADDAPPPAPAKDDPPPPRQPESIDDLKRTIEQQP